MPDPLPALLAAEIPAFTERICRLADAIDDVPGAALLFAELADFASGLPDDDASWQGIVTVVDRLLHHPESASVDGEPIDAEFVDDAFVALLGTAVRIRLAASLPDGPTPTSRTEP